MTEPAARTERLPAPAWLAERAERFSAAGGVPATPRRAATVILVRPELDEATRGPGGFEVYIQRRAATMAFAPSMYVFPGGTVDDRDAMGEVQWAGPPPRWWGRRLGLDEPAARSVICAAVREVFEECGVLLAGPDGSTVVGDVAGAEWERTRLALLAREVALVDVLGARGLQIRSDLLAPWARWLTPEFEPHRFDTYFFLAQLPSEQRTRDVGGESEHSVWLAPGQAARLPMLPPTRYTLKQLAVAGSVDRAVRMGANRDVTRPVALRVEADPEGRAWMVLDHPRDSTE